MVPCPNCKQPCGVREVVLRSDRLFDRCSRCIVPTSFSSWSPSRELTPTLPVWLRPNEEAEERSPASGTIELDVDDLEEVVPSAPRTLRMPFVCAPLPSLPPAPSLPPLPSLPPAPSLRPARAPRLRRALSALGWVIGGALIAAIWSAGVLAIQLDYRHPRKAAPCPSAKTSLTNAVFVPTTREAPGTVLELDATPPPVVPPVVVGAVPARRTPTQVEMLVEEGDRTFRAGDYAAAKRIYARALAVSPTFVPARVGMAGVEWTLGDRVEAREHYRAIVNDAPALAPPIARERASMELAP